MYIVVPGTPKHERHIGPRYSVTTTNSDGSGRRRRKRNAVDWPRERLDEKHGTAATVTVQMNRKYDLATLFRWEHVTGRWLVGRPAGWERRRRTPVTGVAVIPIFRRVTFNVIPFFSTRVRPAHNVKCHYTRAPSSLVKSSSTFFLFFPGLPQQRKAPDRLPVAADRRRLLLLRIFFSFLVKFPNRTPHRHIYCHDDSIILYHLYNNLFISYTRYNEVGDFFVPHTLQVWSLCHQICVE